MSDINSSKHSPYRLPRKPPPPAHTKSNHARPASVPGVSIYLLQLKSLLGPRDGYQRSQGQKVTDSRYSFVVKHYVKNEAGIWL